MPKSPTSHPAPADIAAGLSYWSGPVAPEPLSGGITNTNFVVRDGNESFVVRIGEDLPLHGVIRRHEVETCIAAHACGLAPEIVHHEPGAMVMRFIEGATLTAANIRQPEMLGRVVDVIRRCHTDMAGKLRGATLMFWPFQTCRNYLDTVATGSCRLGDRLAGLGEQNRKLERRIRPITPVFCHNDLLAANFIDDGESLWLLDWEYAGWSSAYFDLANLASNIEIPAEQEPSLLEAYFGRSAEPEDLNQLRTMKCASLMRESLWSLVQEQHSTLDFDYESYTDDHLVRFAAAYADIDFADG